MKSKLKFWGYLQTAASIILAASLIELFFYSISEFTDSPLLFLIKCLFFSFLWVYIFFVELKTAITSVKIEDSEIFVKRYCGLGTARVYGLHQISGFKCSVFYSRGNKNYEYLYLMIGDRKIAIISEYYHGNYKDLKKQIVANGIKYIGPAEAVGVRQRIKDIFSR